MGTFLVSAGEQKGTYLFTLTCAPARPRGEVRPLLLGNEECPHFQSTPGVSRELHSHDEAGRIVAQRESRPVETRHGSCQ